MFLVGLTGGVATGKSTVGKMFSALGVPIIDADVMARRIVAPGRPAWRAIRAEFGPSFFDPETGELDRAALRKVIFEDDEQRFKLNRITHPEIYREMCWEAAKCAAAGHQYIVLDLPLLFEVRQKPLNRVNDGLSLTLSLVIDIPSHASHLKIYLSSLFNPL